MDRGVESGQFDQFGRPRIEHLVTIELRYLKSKDQLTPYLVGKGWTYKVHQGRDAMERFMCRPCINELAVMERDWERKRSGERRANKDNYYGVLCGD